MLEPLRALGAAHFSIVLNMISHRGIRVYCDYPSAWQDLYFRNTLYLEDPVFIGAPALRDATTWQDLATGYPVGNVVDQAREFGLHNGISIPVWIDSDGHMLSITLDNTTSPSRSHKDALIREARWLVASLAELPGDETSRLHSRVRFLATQGLAPQEIVEVLRDRVDSLHFPHSRPVDSRLH